jgi:hypothetical protein
MEYAKSIEITMLVCIAYFYAEKREHERKETKGKEKWYFI